MDDKDKLVELEVFPDAVSAYIMKGVLETNGVDYVVGNECMSGIYPGIPVGYVRLYVRQCDLDEARRIVESSGDAGNESL